MKIITVAWDVSAAKARWYFAAWARSMPVKHWLDEGYGPFENNAVFDIGDKRMVLRRIEVNLRPLPVIGRDNFAPEA